MTNRRCYRLPLFLILAISAHWFWPLANGQKEAIVLDAAAARAQQQCKADVVLLLDKSTSVRDEFEKQISFMVQAIQGISVWKPRVRYALVIYSGTYHKVIVHKWDKFDSQQQLIDTLEAVQNRGGTTATGKALAQVLAVLSSRRPAVRTIVLTTTDGYAQQLPPVVQHMASIKAMGNVTCIAVALTDSVNEDELPLQASDNEHVIMETDVSLALAAFRRLYAEATGCGDAGVVRPPRRQWSQWDEWAQCSQVCGGGQRRRSRRLLCDQCDNGDGDEQQVEEHVCNQRPCPQWGSWAPWSSCSVSCGGGNMIRTRTCALLGGCAPGADTDTAECGTSACATWSQWAQWSQCSATCGGDTAQRSRGRLCLPAELAPCRVGDDNTGRMQVEPCDWLPQCRMVTYWSQWAPCTATCDGGTNTRSRAVCTEGACDALEYDERVCNQQPCPQWAHWQHWTVCTKSCGGGSRVRVRQCLDQQAQSVLGGCIGVKMQNDPEACNDFPC